MWLRISISLLIILRFANCLCYSPAGNLSNDVPCNPYSLPSVCCTSGFLCMSNGLCQPADWYYNGSSQFIRGTCSDKTWTAPQCHGYCVADNPTGGEWVMRCNTTFTTTPEYCCSAQDCCSNSSFARLSLGIATVTATAGGAVVSGTVTLTSTTQTSQVKQSSTITPISIPKSEFSTTSVGSSTGAHAATTSSSTSTSSSVPNHMALSIGLGVGLSVAAILLIGALWFFFSHRRRSPKAGEQNEKIVYDGPNKNEGPAKFPQIPELNNHWQGHQVHSESRILELAG